MDPSISTDKSRQILSKNWDQFSTIFPQYMLRDYRTLSASADLASRPLYLEQQCPSKPTRNELNYYINNINLNLCIYVLTYDNKNYFSLECDLVRNFRGLGKVYISSAERTNYDAFIQTKLNYPKYPNFTLGEKDRLHQIESYRNKTYTPTFQSVWNSIRTSYVDPITFFRIMRRREGCEERFGLGYLRQRTIEQFTTLLRTLEGISILGVHCYLTTVALLMNIRVSPGINSQFEVRNDPGTANNQLQELTKVTQQERMALINRILQVLQSLE